MNSAAFYVPVTDADVLLETLPALLVDSGFAVLDAVVHHFQPHGMTAMWLLGESHLAVHTFPENGHSFIEIVSCVPAPYWQFMRRLMAAYELAPEQGNTGL